MTINSILRLLKKHISILPQLPIYLKTRTLLLQFPPTPSWVASGNIPRTFGKRMNRGANHNSHEESSF